MAFVRYSDGPAVYRQKPRPARPDRRQDHARRDLHWLHAVEIGLPDPVLGRIRPYSIAELARLWGLTRRAVEMGLVRARTLRAAVRAGVADVL